MIGRNELLMNEATMIEAIEVWLASQMVQPPKVTGIEQAEGRGGGAKVFKVCLNSEPAD